MGCNDSFGTWNNYIFEQMSVTFLIHFVNCINVWLCLIESKEKQFQRWPSDDMTLWEIIIYYMFPKKATSWLNYVTLCRSTNLNIEIMLIVLNSLESWFDYCGAAGHNDYDNHYGDAMVMMMLIIIILTTMNMMMMMVDWSYFADNSAIVLFSATTSSVGCLCTLPTWRMRSSSLLRTFNWHKMATRLKFMMVRICYLNDDRYCFLPVRSTNSSSIHMR